MLVIQCGPVLPLAGYEPPTQEVVQAEELLLVQLNVTEPPVLGTVGVLGAKDVIEGGGAAKAVTVTIRESEPEALVQVSV